MLKTATFAVAWGIIGLTAHAEERVAIRALSGQFEVVQNYQSGQGQEQGEFIEAIRFSDAAISQVGLANFPWPGIYHISPDERWMIRTQKTGSGESIGILYQLEANGRVSEVIGFNDLLWKVSDRTERLKKQELYHTKIAATHWSEDGKSLSVTLSGGNAAKSDDGFSSQITYDLESNKITLQAAAAK